MRELYIAECLEQAKKNLRQKFEEEMIDISFISGFKSFILFANTLSKRSKVEIYKKLSI